MSKKILDLSDKNMAVRSMNQITLTGYIILSTVLSLAYLIEVLKGARTISSYCIILLLSVIPSIISVVLFLKNRAAKSIRYSTSIGFMCLYSYLLFNTESELVFCYIIVFFVLMVVYTDFKLLLAMGLVAFFLNVTTIVLEATTTGLTPEAITNAEIVLACLALTIIYTMLAVKNIASVTQSNINKAAEGKLHSDRILDTTLQIAKEMTASITSAVSETDSLKQAIDMTQQDMSVLTRETNDAANMIEIQRAGSEQINEHMQSVETAVESIVNEVANAENSLNSSDKIIKELLYQVQISKTSSAQVTEEMNTLKDYADKMQDIMSLIQSIADQTGLLALNASIEAARAGEAGRGFAVVATEISNLSSQTKTATENISVLITNVVKSVDGVNQSMENLLESNQMQNQYVDDTVRNFDTIHDCTNEISQQIAYLKDTVEVTTKENSKVAEHIENVSDIMLRASEGANETLANCNHNLQSIANVITIMNHLTQSADQLNFSAVSTDS